MHTYLSATSGTILILLLFLTDSVNAQASTETQVGDYTIHHTVFNSSFISPQIAKVYELIRGPNKAIVNIAVTRDSESGQSLGLPVNMQGFARNLMQQETALEFIEIAEGDATYYLAPFEFHDQELLHFYINVRLPGESSANELHFSKVLYHDR